MVISGIPIAHIPQQWRVDAFLQFPLLLYSDLEIAISGINERPAWFDIQLYALILSALVAFSWLVLSDMAISERAFEGYPLPSPKEHMLPRIVGSIG
ncbi:hypothetical protein D5R40_29475 [Okeania hirsuta]|uniref:Uncharacterized protein n=1 Tax=Okeania hirsuta TaxID=1458930 RepID=A0A3N6Q4A7_9CYAN|nr:hypothetical protein D5R40_29475 [Okeania hirsuta]